MRRRVPGNQATFYSGHTYAQRPVAFSWEGQNYQVETVMAESMTPEGKIFLVRTTSGEAFELVYQEDEND